VQFRVCEGSLTEQQPGNLGFFPRQQLAAGSWTDFGFCISAETGAKVEVQKEKFDGPSLDISQGEVAAPQKRRCKT